MGVTQMVTPQAGGGKRLIMPGERELPDHKKSLTLSGEVRTYRNGRAVVFVRLGMIEPWGFRVIAVDERTSIPLVHTQAETYEIAVNRIESDLRDLDVID
jgi:hypothetical protein